VDERPALSGPTETPRCSPPVASKGTGRPGQAPSNRLHGQKAQQYRRRSVHPPPQGPGAREAASGQVHPLMSGKIRSTQVGVEQKIHLVLERLCSITGISRMEVAMLSPLALFGYRSTLFKVAPLAETRSIHRRPPAWHCWALDLPVSPCRDDEHAIEVIDGRSVCVRLIGLRMGSLCCRAASHDRKKLHPEDQQLWAPVDTRQPSSGPCRWQVTPLAPCLTAIGRDLAFELKPGSRNPAGSPSSPASAVSQRRERVVPAFSRHSRSAVSGLAIRLSPPVWSRRWSRRSSPTWICRHGHCHALRRVAKRWKLPECS
jgi:hypothetical protein